MMTEEKNAQNMQKYENYREQFKRLDKALKYQFYLEAVFIAYAILEDRTKSILCYAGQWLPYLKSRKKHGENILTPPEKDSLWKRFFEKLTGPFGHHIKGWEDGDELILFSDGVIDIQNEKEEYYGRERLLDAVKLNIGKSAAEQVSFIANNIYSFCGSREQNDDLTIIVLKK